MKHSQEGADAAGRGKAAHQGVSLGSGLPAAPEPALGYRGGAGLHPPEERDHVFLTGTRHQMGLQRP